MSVMGTGTAAAVAQTAVQAQQVARRRDRERKDSKAEAQRVTELLEVHLRALEEGDEADTAAQLHIDGELPQHHSSQPTDERMAEPNGEDAVESAPVERERDETNAGDDAEAEATGAETVYASRSTRCSEPLYRHLDIKA